MVEKPLPRYWASEMPAGLTTENGLARLRRKLAPKQRPVAFLVYGRRQETSPVYRIGDAVPLPPLTPAQREAARRRRQIDTVCRVCGVDTGHPLGGGQHTPGVCDACVHDRRYQNARENRGELRRKSSAWAVEVLADPSAVLVDVSLVEVRQPETLQVVKRWAIRSVGIVPTTTGDLSWFNILPAEKPKRLMDLPPGVHPGTGLTAPKGEEGQRYRGVPIGEVAMTISDLLRNKRVIVWQEYSTRTLFDDIRHAVTGYGYISADQAPEWGWMGPRQRRPLIGDHLQKRYSEWVGTLGWGEQTLHGSLSWGITRQSAPELDPGDRVMWMLEQVRRMAAAPERGDYP